MYGDIGKPRSKFGRFIDKENITQQDLVKTKLVSVNTVTKACNTDGKDLTAITKDNLLLALEKVSGKKKKRSDFWT